MTKKILALLLAVAMVFGLAACTQPTPSQTKAPEQTTQQGADQTTEAPDPNQIWPKYDTLKTVNCWFPTIYEMTSLQHVEDAINKISEERYNIHYNLTMLGYGVWTNQLNLALTGDAECDTFSVSGLTNLVKNDQIYPITEFFKNDPRTSTIVEWQDRFMKRNWVNGELYALLYLVDFGHYLSFNITEDVAAHYGITKFQELSLAEIDELLAKFKKDFVDDPNSTYKYAIAPTGTTYFLGNMFWTWDPCGDSSVAAGVLPNKGQDDEVKLECIFDNKDYITWANYARKWYTAGYTVEDITSNDKGWNQLLNDKIACGCFDTYGVNNVAGSVRTRVKEVDHWSQALGGGGYGINRLCKDPELAYRALTLFWYDDDIATLLNNGIEGENYKKNDDGTISYLTGDPVTCGWPGPTIYWILPGSEKSQSLDINGPTFFEDMYDFLDTLVLSKAYGFVYEPGDMTDTYNACVKVINDYYTALNSGAYDVESTLKEAKQKWIDAGGESLMADKQAKLNAYLGK